MSKPKLNWKRMQEAAGPFPPEAFQFVREGLAHTVRICHGDEEMCDEHHVGGRELCFGLKDYAEKRYGLLARTVLERWGVRETGDFGKIVFAMVEAGLMRKTEEDSPEDFVDVFDFDEAFEGVERV